jgi:hypothetical protein
MMLNSILLSAVLLLVPSQQGAPKAGAAHAFKVETGRPFDAALPSNFYLEGNAIPTQKRNAALMMTPSGKQLLFALLDTSGYSSEVQQKYLGMLITEGRITVCAKPVSVGSYGFGLKNRSGSTYFALYNQAGTEVASCPAQKDAKLRAPRPLQVVRVGSHAIRLYLGRTWVEIK